MAGSFIPAKTGFSRVFLIENRARGDHRPSYESCIRAMAPSQGFGDVTRIECPDPERRGAFIEIGQIRGAIERGTISLQGRYASDLQSALLTMAKKRCEADVHVIFGRCTDPRDFNAFTKDVIFESASLTNWSADDLGALGSDENAAINESTDISFEAIYEALPLSFVVKGGDVVMNPVLDVVICDQASCGDCEDVSDGCEKIYAVTANAPGSPGTAPDLLYSLDKGVTWAADDISSMLSSEDANALACLGIYVVVVSEDSESLHYKERADIDAGTPLLWTEEDDGFVANYGPLDIWSVGTYAFIVGETGYVYGTSDPAAGVTVLDAGIATNNNLNAVHALSDEFAVAVGDSDTIIYTKNQASWEAATATGGNQNLLCVWVKSKDEWWVGDSVGDIYYTLDGGVSWTQKELPGANWVQINDISFATDSIGYISAEKTVPVQRGFMLRTRDGGYSWAVLPEDVGTLPLSDAIDAHAACSEDINFIVGVGLAEDGEDGIIVVGND